MYNTKQERIDEATKVFLHTVEVLSRCGYKIDYTVNLLIGYGQYIRILMSPIKKTMKEKVLSDTKYINATIFDQALADSYIEQFEQGQLTEDSFKIAIYLLLQIQL